MKFNFILYPQLPPPANFKIFAYHFVIVIFVILQDYYLLLAVKEMTASESHRPTIFLHIKEKYN